MQVYVIGGTSKLGKWKIEGGLKVSYAGESIWETDCVIQRGDIPFQYSFGILYL